MQGDNSGKNGKENSGNKNTVNIRVMTLAEIQTSLRALARYDA